MDANGTRVHLLLGETDWRERTSSTGIEWNGDRDEIILQRRPFHFPAAEGDRPPRIEDRRGAARDGYGNWYWIDASSTEILVRSAGSRLTSTFWSPATAGAPAREPVRGTFEPLTPADRPPVPAALRGLVITGSHYLIVGTFAPDGLLVFDLHGGGTPQHLCWPDDVPFAPLDMAPEHGGGAWILDRENSRLWMLDRALRVVQRTPLPSMATEPFSPADAFLGERRRVCEPRPPIRMEDAWPAPAHAVAIEPLPGGAFLILDRPPQSASTVHYYAAAGETPLPLSLHGYGAGIAGHDIAYVARGIAGDLAATPTDTTANCGCGGSQATSPGYEGASATAAAATDHAIGQLFVVSHEGNQAYAFTLWRDPQGVRLTRVPEYFPMRLFGGKGLVGTGADAYYDFGRTWIPLIEQRRPRHVVEGDVLVAPLDGREPDCVWHRLLFDACIPSDASVDVWSRAANERAELSLATWRREERPYLRWQSELPFAPSVAGDGAGTWELLFQNARGRFLELRLVLRGNGRSTPRLRAARVYYPRFSYLQYLPAVYREDPESASFLDRYLANLEGMLTSIEDRIAASQALIDVRSAPPNALEWLASWVGLALDPTWDDRKRRLLLQHAPIVFARRGTIDGLRIALALSLYDCATPELFTATDSRRSPAAGIRIVEQFRSRRVPPVVSGDPTQVTGLREVQPEAWWTPRGGRDLVDAAWGGAFPLAEPADRERARAWRALAMQMLGFTPGVARVGAARWRTFLAGRYHGVASFNEIYSRTGHAPVRSFDEVPVPAALPPDGAPLVDWYEFETRVIAMAQRAHRFLVLLPMEPDAQADSPRHQRELEIARRVTAIEKPAHTSFDVRFYWALFRVGEVRLGLDTVIGPRRNLLTPFVLDRSHIGESFLAPGHPQNVRDRALVTGRGRLEPPRARTRATTGEGS